MAEPEDQRDYDARALKYFRREERGWKVTPPAGQGGIWTAESDAEIVMLGSAADLAAELYRRRAAAPGAPAGGPAWPPRAP